MDKFTITLQNMCFYFLIAYVLLSLSPSATAREVEDQSEFSYDLNSTNGPNNWGNIRPEWFLCNNGTMQSPIDLRNNRVQSRRGELQRKYKPANATLVNRGHDIEVRFEADAGYIVINGTRYYLIQCHWHSPAEHAIDGVGGDLELHCVHESSTNRTAVIGILYKVGLIRDPFLAMFTDELMALANGAHETPAGIVDPRRIDIIITQYYRYIGSFTVPPCSEDVVWTVVKRIKNVSRAQLQLLRDAVHDGFETNARPLQPLNNRLVQLYRLGISK